MNKEELNNRMFTQEARGAPLFGYWKFGKFYQRWYHWLKTGTLPKKTWVKGLLTDLKRKNPTGSLSRTCSYCEKRGKWQNPLTLTNVHAGKPHPIYLCDDCFDKHEKW